LGGTDLVVDAWFDGDMPGTALIAIGLPKTGSVQEDSAPSRVRVGGTPRREEVITPATTDRRWRLGGSSRGSWRHLTPSASATDARCHAAAGLPTQYRSARPAR